MSTKHKKPNRFAPLGHDLSRSADTRTERKTNEDKPLILFSFKDFQFNAQIPPGQNYNQWQDEGILAYMLEKFGSICNMNRIEAERQQLIKVYGEFPLKSKFKNPFPDRKLDWAVVMRISGQKGRVAGHIIGHVFYVVFLDAEHLFFPSDKKNT